MTWIQFPENVIRVNPAVLADSPDEFDEPIEPNDNGSANVSKETAEYLLSDDYDGEVSEYTKEDN